LTAADLATWLDCNQRSIAERWRTELLARTAGLEGPELSELLGDFLVTLVSMMPGALGPARDEVDPIWRQTAELFGNLATLRGLASGEAIEEFQLLRDAIFRLIYADGSEGDERAMLMRDLLRLNRLVDTGVTMASVGHTDSLFFALFQGSGVRSEVDAPLIQEYREQLRGLREDYEEVLRHLPEGV
jgi:hypothetical protein